MSEPCDVIRVLKEVITEILVFTNSSPVRNVKFDKCRRTLHLLMSII